MAFDVGEAGGKQLRCLVTADGLGGSPNGQEAARIAVEAAARDAVESADYANRTHHSDPQAFATKAIFSAASALMRWGETHDIEPGSLRTTLTVVLMDGDKIGWSYIGDGAIYIVRDNGQVEAVMIPQKANAPNVLWASLGRFVDGGVISGSTEQRLGDVVIAGTDGVFDRVSPDFPIDLLWTALHFEGDLMALVEHAIGEMCEARDPCGDQVFDDNITLGIAASGRPPAFLRQGEPAHAATTPVAIDPVKEVQHARNCG